MDFYGLPVKALSNRFLRVEYLSEAGPRLVRLFLAGSERNLLAELPDASTETPYGTFHNRGGHRLWHAPEAMPRTYIPDNQGLSVKDTPNGVLLEQPVEPFNGIAKSLEIRLLADRPGLELHHTLRNEGPWPVQLAAWAITQLPLGGLGVLPQNTARLDEYGLLPNRLLVLWPYTHLCDDRVDMHDDYLLLHARPALPPYKVGCPNLRGWIAYIHSGIFFLKRFTPQPGGNYPDYGCTAEFYCNDLFIEMETLGPLVLLQPGDSTRHIEIWEFFPGIETPSTLGQVRELARFLHFP